MADALSLSRLAPAASTVRGTGGNAASTYNAAARRIMAPAIDDR